ncbi:hypothetical protein SPFM7_00087 [Salmonella phage SPFM7]|nr:hypothetical protein SPFM7_00087 [Salmonella phage SPFM7]
MAWYELTKERTDIFWESLGHRELFKFLLTETLKVVDSDAGRIKTGYLIPIYLDGVAPGRSAVGSAADAWVVGQHQSQPYEDSIMADTVNWISDELTVNTTLDLAGSVEQPKRLVFFYVNGDALPIAERNPNNTIFTGTTALLVKWFKEALPRSWEQLEAWFTKLRINLMEEEVEGFLEYPRITLIRFIDDMVTCQKANRQEREVAYGLPSFFVEEGLNMNDAMIRGRKVPIISLMHMGL